jgi:hypothetical protein
MVRFFCEWPSILSLAVSNHFVHARTWSNMPEKVSLSVRHLSKASKAPNRWVEFFRDPVTFLSGTEYIKRDAAGTRDGVRVFLSYRHAEASTGEDAQCINSEHRMWVSNFARDLEARGIEVIWDHLMREHLRSRSTQGPEQLPFSAEISRICPVICNVFIPILTPRYLERVGFADGGHQSAFEHGAIFEEWQQSLWLSQQHCMKVLLVARAGEEKHFENLPAWFNAYGIYDLRPENSANYAKCLNMIVSRILRTTSQYPAMPMDLADWIDLYIDWCCANVADRTSTPIERWLWRMDLPSQFLGDVGNVKRRVAAEG